jgi:nitroreductase/dihydropteridine reductase
MKDTKFLDALRWRYSTKKMNGQEIPTEKLDAILEAIRLTPSSFGLTPYSVVVVQDKEIQAKLLPHCFNQSQIVDASALLVFAPWKNINADQVDAYMKEIAETRKIPVESLNQRKNQSQLQRRSSYMGQQTGIYSAGLWTGSGCCREN